MNTGAHPTEAVRPARVLILRLSPFRDVTQSSGHAFLADAVRRCWPGAAIDFAFLPARVPARPDASAVRGMLTQTPLEQFDLALVSNTFVLEAVNLPYLLHACGCSPWAAERPPTFPPIILGGSNALACSCLVRPDGTAVPDVLFFGEGEGALEAFLRAWAENAGADKRSRLEKAALAADGFWVTGAWPSKPVRQAVACDLPPPPGPMILLDSEHADTVRLQASLGCPAFCAFCFEGYERKPYRERPAAWLLDHARRLKAASGARNLELDAFNLNTHRELPGLVAGLSRLFDRVAFKSQRVDILAARPALIQLELAAGKRSFTLGIEGISADMRAFLGKSLTDAEIAAVVRELLTAGARELKLFFVLTGHEAAADLAAFDRFVRDVSGWAGGARRLTRVIFSFARLVRMPNTPLRHDRLFLDRAHWDARLEPIEASCRRAQFEFRLSATWPEYLATQWLAAADGRATQAVVQLAQEGFHYAGELSPAACNRLEQALRATGMLDDSFAAPKPAGHPFPFDFVRKPVSADFLWRQYQAACDRRDRGYCLGATCLACGACRNARQQAERTRRPRLPRVPPGIAAEVAGLVAAKQRLHPVLARVRLDPSFAGRHAEWVSARLLQMLLAAWPDEIDNLLSAEECLFDAPANRDRFPIPSGETLVALRAWDPGKLMARLHAGAPPELEIVPAAPDDHPGTFVSARWTIRADGPAQCVTPALTDWLKDARLPHTLRKHGGAAAIEFAAAATRKRVVLAAACAPEGQGAVITLTVTPKADMRELIRRLERCGTASNAACSGWDRAQQPATTGRLTRRRNGP